MFGLLPVALALPPAGREHAASTALSRQLICTPQPNSWHHTCVPYLWLCVTGTSSLSLHPAPALGTGCSASPAHTLVCVQHPWGPWPSHSNLPPPVSSGAAPPSWTSHTHMSAHSCTPCSITRGSTSCQSHAMEQHLALQKGCATAANMAGLPLLKPEEPSLMPNASWAHFFQLPCVYIALQSCRQQGWSGQVVLSVVQHRVALQEVAVTCCWPFTPTPSQSHSKHLVLRAGYYTQGWMEKLAGELFSCMPRVRRSSAFRQCFFSSSCSLVTEDYSEEAAGDISYRCGIWLSQRLLPSLSFYNSLLSCLGDEGQLFIQHAWDYWCWIMVTKLLVLQYLFQ